MLESILNVITLTAEAEQAADNPAIFGLARSLWV